MKVGILGGSFNPPHLGHLLLSVWALSLNNLDKVFVIPCFKHPFGKKLIPFNHRFKMCKLLFNKLKKIVKVSDIEKKLGTVSKTIITLKKLRTIYPKAQFFLLVGSDILKEKAKWYKIDEIEKNYKMIVIPRGRQKDGLYIPDIKSREIRDRIRKGKIVSNYLPKAVLDYIKQNKLYKS